MIAMSESHAVAGFSEADFQGFLAPRREPAWLTTHRKQSWQAFQEMPWPARNDEEWIRTDIRLFRLDQFQLPYGGESGEPSSDALPPALLAHGVNLAGQTTAINGRAAQSRLSDKWKQKGVLFGSLDQLVGQHPDLVRKWLFTKAVDPTYDRFAALHAACWSGGHFVYVPRNVVVDEPLHCMSTLAAGEVDFGHLLVVLEDGAQATVLTETGSIAGEGKADAGFHCGATEVIVGDGAHLRLVGLQNWDMGTWHFAHQKAVVGRDASLQWTIAAIGSRLAKVNQHVALAGPGAQCQVNGVLFTEGKQHISYHTLQHHEAPSTRSDFLYKAALQDKSRTVWRGMIKVDHDAQKTDGYQRNDNLMLSTTARADSIPGLEIEADDVRCTHGSTTGKVDEELLFYCQSRGLTRKEASRAIVAGFFQQISDRITIDSVRDALASAIASRVREYQ